MANTQNHNSGTRAHATANRRFKHWSVLAAALATSVPDYACQPKQPAAKMRCYDQKADSLRVYLESKALHRGETGRELQLKVPGMALGKKPLAYFCTYSGHLLWVTDNDVHVRKIDFGNNGLSVSQVLDARHTKPDEYSVPGVQVVSADIWRNPDAAQEKIIVATLTNTGIMQLARYSIKDMANNDTDRTIIELSNLKPGNRWPKEGVAGAVVKALDERMFVAIPLGERGKGNVRNFYNIDFSGNGMRLTDLEPEVHTMQPWKHMPDLKNIYAVTSGVRYDRDLGGWVANLMGENMDGKEIPIFPILTP